jgi:hypothetical protein
VRAVEACPPQVGATKPCCFEVYPGEGYSHDLDEIPFLHGFTRSEVLPQIHDKKRGFDYGKTYPLGLSNVI